MIGSIEELYQRRTGKIKPGLERMRVATRQLSFDPSKKPIVIVAGTNGKGTTAGYLWWRLAQAGHRCGLYTSPHLLRFSERIQVSHATVNDPRCLAAFRDLQTQFSKDLWDELSFFELATLAAMQIFHDYQTEIDIYEVGLGGRWDSVNILEPSLTVLTSVGLDHQFYLGETCEEIAREKLGICRPGTPLIWTGVVEQDRDKVEAVIGDTALRLGFPLLRFELKSCSVEENDRLAQFAATTLLGKSPDFCQPLAKPPCLRGRQQVIRIQSQELVLDTAHNFQAVQRFLEFVRTKFDIRHTPAIVSLLADKDFPKIMDIIDNQLPAVSYFVGSGERQIALEDFQALTEMPTFQGFSEAWQNAQAQWKGFSGPWLIFGSVQRIGEVLAYFESLYTMQVV